VNNFKETLLWKMAFESEQAKAHQSSVEALVASFTKARENARVLVSEISIDLPNYTVHDIEHLDALWEISSQIVGPDFFINPVEGFVLGCSFLFHDSAMTMAAYPGGLEEIKDSREWKRIHNRIKSTSNEDIDDASIIEIFLREQHAIRAGNLPKVSWKGDSGLRYLIDDADARDKFGDFIGQVAASHWWDHSKLENSMQDKIIPAPSPFPSSWSIDLLKLACVLRVADAAQIDERRAPGFLRALRKNRLSDYSNHHWTFQNKLTQAQNRNDTLYFAALRPFPKTEAKEWWMLHDTLKMIDVELRKTDDLLARRRGNECRFAARRVSNIESAANLKTCIQTDGWHPIDTEFSISDIPQLIANLGGDQLYGHDNMAALREIIQNAMDSVRLRQIVDPQAPSPLVEVELIKEKDSYLLNVRDNGVGMSEVSIVENLLSFGKSGWLSDTAIGEYNDNFPHKNNVSGRYGIGFFSIFMLGDTIAIKSRRFDSSPDQTTLLSFPEGLNTRPLLCGAEYTDRMTAGGTEISVYLDMEKLQKDLWYSETKHDFWSVSKNGIKVLNEAISRSFPTSNVPIKVTFGDIFEIIDGRNWETEPVSDFLKRVEGDSYLDEIGLPFESTVSLIKEDSGEIVGRATLYPDRLSNRYHPYESISGTVSSQGAKICTGSFRGVLLGIPVRAARDFASLLASSEAIQKWATEQSFLLQKIVSKDEDQETIAEQIASIGGNIGHLKFCEIGGSYFNKPELLNYLKQKNEVWVIFNSAASLERPKDKPSKRTESCISVGYGVRGFINGPLWARSLPELENQKALNEIVLEIISEEFNIPDNVIKKLTKIEDGHSVYKASSPAWQCDDGTVVFIDGQYFKRNMSLDDVDQFFSPEKQTDD